MAVLDFDVVIGSPQREAKFLTFKKRDEREKVEEVVGLSLKGRCLLEKQLNIDNYPDQMRGSP